MVAVWMLAFAQVIALSGTMFDEALEANLGSSYVSAPWQPEGVKLSLNLVAVKELALSY